MHCIVPNEKQKLSLREKYRQYLSELPEPPDNLHNKYNLFDDVNSVDKAIVNEAKLYLHRSNIESKSNLIRQLRRKLCRKIEAARQLRNPSK